jgi:hypothetical protein
VNSHVDTQIVDAHDFCGSVGAAALQRRGGEEKMNLLQRSSFLGRIRANFLAVGSGTLIAALATSAFAIGCSNNLGGPFYADVPIDIVVGGWLDGNPSPESVSISWGDGTSSTESSVGHCRFVNNRYCAGYGHTVAGVHTYSTIMSGISISLHFGGASCTTNTFDVVAVPPPTPGGDVLTDPAVALTTEIVGVPVTGLIAQFKDSNPNSFASYFTALIDWGDGAQSEGVIARFPGAGTVWNVSAPPGGHTYANWGVFTVSVSLNEVAPGTASSTATGTIGVATRPTTPGSDVLRRPRLNLTSATVGVPLTGGIATFADSNPSAVVSNFFALIQWGDGTDSYGVISYSTGKLSVSAPPGGHTYATPGLVEVFVELTEAAPGTASSTAGGAVAVAGPPPPPQPPPPPSGGDMLSNPTLQLASAHVGVPVTGVIATFTDSNPSAITSDFTALIDWGDHAQSTGVVSSTAGAFSVSAPAGGHTYGQSAVVDVSVSLSAPGVASSTATGTVAVGRHH